MKPLYNSLTCLLVLCGATLFSYQGTAQCSNDLGIIAYPSYCNTASISLMVLQNNPNYNLPQGGTWTNPNGNPVPAGILNPLTDPFGIYTYTYIDSEGCTVTAQLQVLNYNSSGEPTTITICTTDEPFQPFELLGGNPTPGGQWLANNVGAPFPGFVAFYPSSQFLVEIDPATLTQDMTFTYATGTPPCVPEFVDLTIHVIQGGISSTELVTSCLPFEWNGNLYEQAGTYSEMVNTGEDCNALAVLQLTELSGGTLSLNGEASVCSGSVNASTLDVQLSGDNGPNSLWYITPATTTNIVAIAFDGPEFNWNLIPPGNYKLWHASYTDGSTIVGVSDAAQFDGCHNISNAIDFEVEGYTAGVIGTPSNTTICLNQGPVSINASVTAAAGPYALWILTDNSQNILAQGISSSEFNLNVLSPGAYAIYHVVSTAPNALLGVGNLGDAPECVFLSNPISISAANCFGDFEFAEFEEAYSLNSLPNPTWGISTVSFELPNTEQAVLEVYDSSGRLLKSLFQARAEAGVQYRFDFDSEGLPAGIYLYRLSTPQSVRINKFMVK